MGIPQLLREKDPRKLGFLAWVVGAFVCAYLPTGLQRRFMHGMTIPLSVIAVVGLRDGLIPWKSKRRQILYLQRPKALALLVLGLASLSSIYFILGTSMFLALRPDAYFDSYGLVTAVDWLTVRAGRDDFVMSSERTGQLVAARAGLPVYLGHPMETVDYQKKTDQVSAFFEKKPGMATWNVSCCAWLIFGPYEGAQVGDNLSFPNYQKAYSNRQVTIYQKIP
jgi:hypothetical protein